MASVKMFTDMLDQFVTELNLTFPENKTVEKYQSSIAVIKIANPRQIVTNFMKVVKPHSAAIMSKNESFIMNEQILPEVRLDVMWTELSDQSKDSIWQYLQSLLTIGTMVTSIPKKTLDSIEKMAQDMAQGMAEGDGEMPDMSSILNLLQKSS